MANKIVPEALKKTHLTIRISKYVIDELRKNDNYNKIIEDALIEKLKIKMPDVEK